MTITAGADQLGAVIGSLAPTSLPELDRVATLDIRLDRKYVLAPSVVVELLDDVAPRLAALEIDDRRSFRYESLYFDTGHLESYRSAALSRRRRFKVRTRMYCDQEICVLEVKTRGPRGRTVKHRMPYLPHERRRLTAAGQAFVDECTATAGLGCALHPVLETAYMRSAFVGHADGSRMTVDRDVTCTDEVGSVTHLDAHVVLETKSVGTATAVDRWLWRHGHRPTRISKFGVGMAALHPELPANKWNQVLTRFFT